MRKLRPYVVLRIGSHSQKTEPGSTFSAVAAGPLDTSQGHESTIGSTSSGHHFETNTSWGTVLKFLNVPAAKNQPTKIRVEMWNSNPNTEEDVSAKGDTPVTTNTTKVGTNVGKQEGREAQSSNEWMSDELLGHCSISVNELARGVVRDDWFRIQECATKAEVHLRLRLEATPRITWKEVVAGLAISLGVLFVILGTVFVNLEIEKPPSTKGTPAAATRKADSGASSRKKPLPPSWGPTKSSPRDRLGDRLHLGLQQCGSLPFVEWENPHQGIVRLLNMDDDPPLRRSRQVVLNSSAASSAEKRLLTAAPFLEGPRVCNPNEIRYRCCDNFTRTQADKSSLSKARQDPENWFHFEELQMVTRDPETGECHDFQRQRRSGRSKMESWVNTFFKVPVPSACMCVVFECASACDPGLDPSLCYHLGRRNTLLRYPLLPTTPPPGTLTDIDEDKRISREANNDTSTVVSATKATSEVSLTTTTTASGSSGNADTTTSGNAAPNILLLMVDSLNWPDFKSRFKWTIAFLEKLKKKSKKQDTEPRVAMFENSNSIGSSSCTNQPAMYLGKMPKACWNDPAGTSLNVKFRSQVLNTSSLFRTKKAMLGSHLLKIAKDAGYTMTAGLFPNSVTRNPSRETNCIKLNSEEDMRQYGGADVFQWHYYDETCYWSHKATNGREGCLGDRPHIDYVEQMVEALFLPHPAGSKTRKKNTRTDRASVSSSEKGVSHQEELVLVMTERNTTEKEDYYQGEGEGSIARHTGPVLAIVADQTAHQESWETGAMSYFDVRVARMLRMMYHGGALEDTVVVFSSDHGHGYREVPKAESMALHSHNSHPVLWYLLPPARPSATTINEKGRRHLGLEQQAMISNIVENAQKNMFVTHFDTHATLSELAESSHSAVWRKNASATRREIGVVQFARPLTANYTEQAQGNSTELTRLLHPDCQDVGVPRQKCRSYMEVDVTNQTETLRRLKEGVKAELVEGARGNPHCLDWNKLPTMSHDQIKLSKTLPKFAEFRQGFEVTNMTRRDFIDPVSGKPTGVFFFGLTMEVPLFSGDWGDPEQQRTLLFYAETTVHDHMHTSFARMIRTSTYKDDRRRCGAEVRRYHRGKKTPKVSFDFCVCDKARRLSEKRSGPNVRTGEGGGEQQEQRQSDDLPNGKDEEVDSLDSVSSRSWMTPAS